MRNHDTVLHQRIRGARGVLREIIDLAELQGWTFRVKDEGLLFFPPKASQRPGMSTVFASDPGNQSHLQRQMKDRFRKAGMKFPEDQPPQRTEKVTTAPKPIAAPVPASAAESPFTQIRQKIETTVTLLSDIEQLLMKIEADNAQVKLIRDALKSLGN